MTEPVKNVVQELLDERMLAEEDVRRQEVRQAALEWGRHWASYFGEDVTHLPGGQQGNPDACVFAMLLGGSWNGTTWKPHEGDTEISTPPEVQEFIKRFDGGEYPDLAVSLV